MLKNTGIVRNLDALGRVVIPMELRRTMGIPEGAPLEIYTEGNKIVLCMHRTACVFCGEDDAGELIHYGGQLLCRSCARHLATMAQEAPSCGA